MSTNFGNQFRARPTSKDRKEGRSLSVTTHWAPLLTAMVVSGDLAESEVPAADRGAPIRFKVDENGNPVLNKNGEPVTVTAPSIKRAVKNFFDNMEAEHRAYVEEVSAKRPAQHAKAVAANRAEGLPLVKADQELLAAYLAKQEEMSKAIEAAMAAALAAPAPVATPATATATSANGRKS